MPNEFQVESGVGRYFDPKPYVGALSQVSHALISMECLRLALTGEAIAFQHLETNVSGTTFETNVQGEPPMLWLIIQFKA